MLRSLILLAALTASIPVLAADKYAIDPGHSQARFGYNHMGFSNIVANFESVTGEIMLDSADITKSSVSVTVPIASLRSGVVKLDQHLQSPDFFDMAKFANATFTSTKIDKTGDKTFKLTGDLTIHGVTKSVTFDATINGMGEHPMAKVPAAGFDAHAVIKRSDFGLGAYVPAVSDEVKLSVTIEAKKAP
jgi:polyisoprenoid-binding protein YceI